MFTTRFLNNLYIAGNSTMSKGKNKGRESFVHQKTFFSPEIIEEQARDDLEKKKFRQAKDGFKELCKLDKEKYLPKLLECYHGLANQMIQNGQLSDAAQIIDNIKALTGDKDEGTLDILIAMKKKDYDAVARIYADLLSRGKNLANIQELPRVADALVIVFQEFPQLKSACPEIDEELCAVQHALEDISAERYEEAWLKAKKIAVHSLFSHWKLFIKGLIAFYKKEDQRALEALGRISSNTLLRDIAQPYMALLNSKIIDRNTIHESFVKKMCIVAGYPDLVSILPRADSLWKAGRYYDSYCHIRNTMKTFPEESSDISGTLTRFYFNSIHHLPGKAAMKYLDDLLKNDTVASPEYNLEKVLICKAESLFFENKLVDDDEDDSDCAQVWECFLETYRKVFGSNNKLESLVYFRLGSLFAVEKPQEPPLFPWLPVRKNKDLLRSAHLAEHYFNKSISMDKNNKDAYLGLLQVYEKTYNQSKANKLLDRLIPLFPDDSAILTRAGVSCVERKSYIKGMKYLEQATQRDPLDSTIKDHLGFSYLKAARVYFDKKQMDQGRNIFEKALKNGVSNAHDFNRGYAYIYARWAVLELKNENKDAANEKLQLARGKAEKLLPLLYFTQLISRCYELPDTSLQKLNAEVDREWSLPPTPENAVALLMIYSYINTLGFAWLKAEMKRVVLYALDASDKPCSRNDALGIVSFALPDKQAHKLGDVYIKKMLEKDREDPQFHYLKYQLQIMNSRRLPGKEGIEELNRILHLAEKRNNRELVRDLRKRIKALEEILKVEDTLNYGGAFDTSGTNTNLNMDMEILEELFEEMQRTMGGRGRGKR